MSAKPNDSFGRTVKPNGELIKQKRIERGWDISAMAAHAGTTEKTVQSIELGNRCFVCTLKAFADAFKLPDLAELLDEPKHMPPPVNGTGRAQVRFKFYLPFANCDLTKWLVNLINKIIKYIDPAGEVEVVGVDPGSIIVVIEMNNKDAKKTVAALGSGELDELEIGSITTNFGYGEAVEFKPIERTPERVSPSPLTSAPAPTPSRPTTAPSNPKPEKTFFGKWFERLFGSFSQSSEESVYKDRSA